MARPTKSNGFYIQMVGRGLRKHQGKENCLVLDFADQYHNLNTIISLSKAIPEAKTIEEEKPKVEREKIVREPRIKTLRDVDHEFDILGRRPSFLWTDIGDGELSLADDGNNEKLSNLRTVALLQAFFISIGEQKALLQNQNQLIGALQYANVLLEGI